MLNARIPTSSPNVRTPAALLNVRVSNFQTTKSDDVMNNITIGMPIGLLLALTYAEPHDGANAFYGDYRPTVRIISI